MRIVIIGLLFALTSSCASGGKHAINLHGGYRSYSGDFDGITSTPAVGLEGMIGIDSTGTSVEFGYSYSEDDKSSIQGTTKLNTNELYAGIRKTWNIDGLVQPYLGIGADWMNGGVNDPLDFEFSGDGLGAYARGGIGFQIAIFQVGGDVRGAWSSADVQGEDLSFVQGTIFIGLSL